MAVAVRQTEEFGISGHADVPNFRGFKAWINALPGGRTKLIVTGAVETHARNMKPVLTPTTAPNTPTTTLVLDMTIVKQGEMGSSAFQYWPARYEEAASKGQFEHLIIRWDGEELISLEVAEIE